MRHLDNHEGQGLEDESANGQSFTQLWLRNEALKKKKTLRRAYCCLLPWILLLHLRELLSLGSQNASMCH